jgi:hypothetical protein
VPGKISLRRGSYLISALGTNSAEFRTEVKISSGKETSLVIKLSKNPTDLLEGSSEQKNISYLNLFPIQKNDWRIEAVLDSNKTHISKLIISVYHQITPDEPGYYSEERSFIVNNAKEWLKTNGIPEDIPIEISDE